MRLRLAIFLGAITLGSVSESSVSKTLTVGAETDFPVFFFGSYAPAGIISASIATYQPLFAARFNVGGIRASQPHFALSVEGNQLFTVNFSGSPWSMDPVFGFAEAHSKPYQRMADKSRVGSNGEHFDTYFYADSAISSQAFAGIRVAKEFPNDQRLSVALGILHEYKFVAGHFREKEIQNCYADDCPHSDKSGGGQWPDPKNAWYLSVGYEIDVMGQRTK